jgi:hypothetical protein
MMPCHFKTCLVAKDRLSVCGVLMSDEEHLYLLGIPWPAGSPDLMVPDFVLWGYLKECAYRNLAHAHA